MKQIVKKINVYLHLLKNCPLVQCCSTGMFPLYVTIHFTVMYCDDASTFVLVQYFYL